MFGLHVLKRFDCLRLEYGLIPTAADEWHVIYENEQCRVQLVLDRIRVEIEIGSNEADETLRCRFALETIAKFNGIEFNSHYSPKPELYERGTYLDSVDRQMDYLISIIDDCATDLLSGDFSRRQELIEFQIENGWLHSLTRISEGDPLFGDIASFADSFKIWYWDKANAETKTAVVRAAKRWLSSTDLQQSLFAVAIVSQLELSTLKPDLIALRDRADVPGQDVKDLRNVVNSAIDRLA